MIRPSSKVGHYGYIIMARQRQAYGFELKLKAGGTATDAVLHGQLSK